MSRYALVSVWDKRGLVDFARGLLEFGFRFLSTGGTARALREAGLDVTEVSEIAGFPEAFGGRLKTLQPLIFGGILFRRGTDDDEAEHLGIPRIDLVCVNLYPFEETAARNPSLSELIEMIDIGGPSLIRAAAKNHESVMVVVDPDDYGWVLEGLRKHGGSLCERGRRRLALKAFARTAEYDSFIYRELWSRFMPDELPDRLFVHAPMAQALRYGENPHQRAAYYGKPPWTQIWGKELSYNNILDATAAWECLSEFSEPAAVIVKHLIPCGVAVRDEIDEAFVGAYEADPVSAFGGIIALNRPLTQRIAENLNKFFSEIVMAPEFMPEALEILKKKKDRRLLLVRDEGGCSEQIRSVLGGFLYQGPDDILNERWELVCGSLDEETSRDLLFAWKVVKHVRSNAIVVAKDLTTLGVGAGQPNRVGSTEIALRQAGEGARGAVLASDAFFPFPDSVELAARAGIKAIVQPGGSVRDQEVLEAARRLGLAMVLTGTRHFKH
ncbi:MAG: bifunctional phosphoribosylaminoimidazolecarboxamide formyltransferase/IMP cyclohydrolase [candidate division WOR-3 bacterium]